MPSFRYEAVNASGQSSSGTLDATDRSEAIRKLARRGLQPHSVSATDDGKEKSAALKKSSATKNKSTAVAEGGIPVTLKRGQVIQFTEELSDLLAAGLQLEQALHSMESRSVSHTRRLAVYLREQVRDGVPFSQALHQASPSFGELYCNLVAAGEASGSLTNILKRQARYLNAMDSVRAKVSAALIYPAFIIVSGIALALVFSMYLLPKLTTLIENTHGQVPVLAQWIQVFSEFVKAWWWLILGFIVLSFITVKILMQNKSNLQIWHRAQLDIPVFGPVLRTRFEVQFLETLGNLIKNGLTLNRALELVKRSTVNLHLRDGLGKVEAMVADGAALSRSLEKTSIARPLVLDMIRVGEQTGDMAGALEKAGERFDRELSRTMDRVTALIQPVIIVVMAILVGTMAWMMINVVYGTLSSLRKH